MRDFRGIIEVPLAEVHENIMYNYQNGNSTCITPSHQLGEFLWLGECYTEEQIKEFVQGLEYVQLPYSLGCIVTSTDDINLSFTTKVPQSYDPKVLIDDLLLALQTTISNYTHIECINDHNDLITSNGKILGSEYAIKHGLYHFAFSLSLTDHTETVKKLGLKYEEKKKPSYINIDNREELMNLIYQSIIDVFNKIEEVN